MVSFVFCLQQCFELVGWCCKIELYLKCWCTLRWCKSFWKAGTYDPWLQQMVSIPQSQARYPEGYMIGIICLNAVIAAWQLVQQILSWCGSLTRHYQHPICAALITVKPGDFPELRIKAYAGRVLVSFLQQKMAQLCQEHEHPTEVMLLVHGTMSALCQWLHLVESAQRYLSEEEAKNIWDTSLVFLAVYCLVCFPFFLICW